MLQTFHAAKNKRAKKRAAKKIGGGYYGKI